MERFNVSVTKLGESLDQSVLNVYIKSLKLDKDKEGMVYSAESVAVFNFLEPRAKFIRIEGLNNFVPTMTRKSETERQDGEALPKSDDTTDAQICSRKSVEILHKRHLQFDLGEIPVSSENNKFDAGQLDFDVIEENVVRIDVGNLKNNLTVSVMFDDVTGGCDGTLQLEKLVPEDKNNNRDGGACSTAGNSDNNEEQISNSSQIVCKDSDDANQRGGESDKELCPMVDSNENGNVDEMNTTEEALNEIGVHAQGNIRGASNVHQDGKVADNLQKTAGLSHHVESPESVQNASDLTIAVGNAIRITLEVQPANGGTKKSTIHRLFKVNLNCTPIPEVSEESFLEPGTTLNFPWYDKEDNNKVCTKQIKQRETRKLLLKHLIYERLRAFGLPYEEVCNITDAWNMGYVQQRAMSFRVPKGRPKWYDPVPMGLNPRTDLELKAETFAHNFLRHTEILQGTLDGATCTVIEATFFLMLPHVKLSGLPQVTIEPLTSLTFIKDWIRVIFTAAHQLKPGEPNSIAGVVNKETKLLKKILRNSTHAGSKIKRKFLQVQENVEHLRKKVLKRIEPNPETTGDDLNTKAQATASTGDRPPGTIYIPESLTAASIFENYVHVAAGRKGLVIKRQITDPWYPYSSLNFLERRVLFLGLTDHMYSTFNTILSTFRHLQELYTTGYPLNVFARINALTQLMRDKKRPYEYLSPRTRSLIYVKVHALSKAVERFCYTFRQLSKITKEAESALKSTWFNPTGAELYISETTKERMHIHLVVPFVTLPLNGLSELKLRGRGVPRDKPIVNSPEVAADTVLPETVNQAEEIVKSGNKNSEQPVEPAAS